MATVHYLFPQFMKDEKPDDSTRRKVLNGPRRRKLGVPPRDGLPDP
jgi:hypothetical protein